MASTQLQKPPSLIGMCNTCRRGTAQIFNILKWVPCSPASLAPLALLLLSQRAFEEPEEPRWRTSSCGGAQASRARGLEAFLLCSGSTWEDTRLSFPQAPLRTARPSHSCIPPPNTHPGNKANRQGYLKNDPNDVN